MIEWLREWIQNIIVIVLLATFADLLLPNSNMQKYAKMVFGLLVILTIISPVLSVFDQFSTNKFMQQLEQELNVKETNAMQMDQIKSNQEKAFREKIVQQVEQAMTEQLQVLLAKKLHLHLKNISLTVNIVGGEWDIANIALTVGKSLENKQADVSSNEIETVKVVSIQLDQNGNNNKKKQHNDKDQDEPGQIEKQVMELIKEEWGIAEEKITVKVETDW